MSGRGGGQVPRSVAMRFGFFASHNGSNMQAVVDACAEGRLDATPALVISNNSGYGNAGVIFTTSGPDARKFRHGINAGMVGVNIGVPAPMAFFRSAICPPW